MKTTHFLQETKKLELQAYKKPEDYNGLKKTHIPFSGSPRKHPYDPEKFILISDPYCSNTIYYEFSNDDISFAEERPSIVNMNGDSINMIVIWVKKMSIGIRCTPFLVDNTVPT